MTDTKTKKQVKTRVRCAVSGIETGCRPDVFEARVKKYGSVEALNRSYVCSAAKRMLREGLTVAEIRLKSNKGDDTSLPTAEELKTIISAIVDKPAAKKSTKAAKKDEPAKIEKTGNDQVDAFFAEAAKTVAKKRK